MQSNIRRSRMRKLSRIHESASAFAKGIGAPDYTDPEHGLRAVLVLCEQEAGKFRQ